MGFYNPSAAQQLPPDTVDRTAAGFAFDVNGADNRVELTSNPDLWWSYYNRWRDIIRDDAKGWGLHLKFLKAWGFTIDFDTTYNPNFGLFPPQEGYRSIGMLWWNADKFAESIENIARRLRSILESLPEVQADIQERRIELAMIAPPGPGIPNELLVTNFQGTHAFISNGLIPSPQPGMGNWKGPTLLVTTWDSFQVLLGKKADPNGVIKPSPVTLSYLYSLGWISLDPIEPQTVTPDGLIKTWSDLLWESGLFSDDAKQQLLAINDQRWKAWRIEISQGFNALFQVGYGMFSKPAQLMAGMAPLFEMLRTVVKIQIGMVAAAAAAAAAPAVAGAVSSVIGEGAVATAVGNAAAGATSTLITTGSVDLAASARDVGMQQAQEYVSDLGAEYRLPEIGSQFNEGDNMNIFGMDIGIDTGAVLDSVGNAASDVPYLGDIFGAAQSVASVVTVTPTTTRAGTVNTTAAPAPLQPATAKAGVPILAAAAVLAFIIFAK